MVDSPAPGGGVGPPDGPPLAGGAQADCQSTGWGSLCWNRPCGRSIRSSVSDKGGSVPPGPADRVAGGAGQRWRVSADGGGGVLGGVAGAAGSATGGADSGAR